MRDDDLPTPEQPPTVPPPTAAGEHGRAHPPPFVPVELPPPRRPRETAGGCRRPGLVGAVVLAAVLVVLLVIGVQLTRRMMWLTADRAIGRVRREALAAPLEPAERQRLLAALDRFGERLPLMDDPYPAIGTFLGRVQADLADDRLSRDEALGLIELLEPLALGEVPR